jgi:hypothetical protein
VFRRDPVHDTGGRQGGQGAGDEAGG